MSIVYLESVRGGIDPGLLRPPDTGPVVRLKAGLISPASEQVTSEVAANHTAEPIKSLDDIDRITDYLTANGRWRDNMLFIVGINFGLRISDLRQLRFCDIINDNLTFRDSFPVFEKKTRNTRKRKKNRYVTINAAVMDAVTAYLEHTPGISLSDYMFRAQSNNMVGENRPISQQGVDLLLKGLARDLDLNVHISSHTLRKTFCYHQLAASGNDGRKLLLLQKMLGHASSAQTLDYIGITEEEIGAAYRELNLGGRHSVHLDSSIVEFEPPNEEAQ